MITADQLAGLDHALNEARLREVYVDEQWRLAQVWIECLTLTPSGDEPDDPLFCGRLNGITRIVASLRNADCDDRDAQAVPVALDELSDVVRSFGGMDIYGWKFFDRPEDSWADWRNRLSLDVALPGAGGNTLPGAVPGGRRFTPPRCPAVVRGSLDNAKRLHPGSGR